MGLDMYLTKKHYVKNWGHNPNKHKIIVKLNGEEREDINPEKISYIVEDVAYWCKFNALHKWFVDNCQEGEDNCKEHYVDAEQLRELLDTLKQAKKVLDAGEDTAQLDTLLPTDGGFFFGSTEYDERYKQNVEKTIEVLENELIYEENGEYYYKSSW